MICQGCGEGWRSGHRCVTSPEPPVVTTGLSLVEYGRQLDCAAEGCDPSHSDNHTVYMWPTREFGPPDLEAAVTINSHAARWVQRTVPEWQLVEPSNQTSDSNAGPSW